MHQTNERWLSKLVQFPALVALAAVSKPSSWVDAFGFDTAKNSLGLLNQH